MSCSNGGAINVSIAYGCREYVHAVVQEWTVNDMRLIDVDDAIKEIKHDLESLWYASDIKRYEEGVEFAIRSLEWMETIEAEPVKHGKWIDVNGDGSLWRCSLCEDTCCCSDNNYCPNCGAVMDGGEKK